MTFVCLFSLILLKGFNKSITQEYISTVKNGFSLSFIASYSTDEEKSELYKILDNIKIEN